MIYGISLNNQRKDNICNISSISEDFSFFSMGIECIRESDEELRHIMKGMYIQSGYNINEGFIDEFTNKKFSIVNIIKAIIKFFLKAIEKIGKSLWALILELVDSDNTIKKYKNELLNYNGSFKIKAEPYYNYTNLGAPVPPVELYLHFNEEYDIFHENILKLAEKSKNGKNEYINRLNNYKSEIESKINTGYYDTLRAQVLSKIDYSYQSVDAISKDDYINKLRAVFRGGASLGPLMNDRVIDGQSVQEATNRFFSAKNILKSLDKDKSKIESSCNETVKKVEKLSSSQASIISRYSLYDNDVKFAIDNISKLKAAQLSEMCNIFILAFSAKADAIKEAVKQDKKICFEAIKDIIVNGGDVND